MQQKQERRKQKQAWATAEKRSGRACAPTLAGLVTQPAEQSNAKGCERF